MAENDKKNVTAQELLNRLKKGKENIESNGNPTYFEFVGNKNNDFPNDNEFTGSFNNDQESNQKDDFKFEDELLSNEISNNNDEDFFVNSNDFDDSKLNESEEYNFIVSESDNELEVENFQDELVTNIDNEIYVDDEIDTSFDQQLVESENFDTINNQDDNIEYFEDADSIDNTSYDYLNEDIIPDDDFFDNDPIEDDEFYDEENDNLSYDDNNYYDPQTDFENLVAQVNGSSNPNEFDETDISLAVALGMEDELTKYMDSDVANQLTEDYVADQEEWVQKQDRYDAGEYTDPSDNITIAEKYKKRNSKALIKMLIAFGLSIILLVYENLPLLGFQFDGVLDPAVYPVIYIMMDLQIIFVIAALVISNIWSGIKSLFTFKADVNSIPAVLLILATVSSIISAANVVPGVEPIMFNFPTALAISFIALFDFLTVRREIFSFNVVSSRNPKYVMRHLSVRDSKMENEAVAQMDLDSNLADEGDVIKIQKTDFVDGYFYHTNNKGTTNNSYFGLAIAASIALGVVVAIYAAVTKTANIVNVGFVTISSALPVSMIFIGCYPFFTANKLAYDNDSTIIGEGSVEEYSGVGVISFDDVNVFSSNDVKVKNVRLYNNSRIDKVLYYASSVFAATGGPLADVFEVATMETGYSENVDILETGNGYIEANVNGKNIIFGNANALANLGIILPEDVLSDLSELPVDCSVMFMIYQRKLVSRMIVSYIIDPDFEYILKELTSSGMCVCVKTYDPNIDEEMIYRQVRPGKYSMRVIKYKNMEEITQYSKRADGGIVSKDSTKTLLHTVSFCDKILSAKKTGYVIGVISCIISSIVIGAIVITGGFNSIYSAIPAALQLFWLIPTFITSRMIVR